MDHPESFEQLGPWVPTPQELPGLIRPAVTTPLEGAVPENDDDPDMPGLVEQDLASTAVLTPWQDPFQGEEDLDPETEDRPSRPTLDWQFTITDLRV